MTPPPGREAGGDGSEGLDGLGAAPGTTGVGVGSALEVASIASVQFGATFATHLFPRVGPLGTVALRILGGGLILLAVSRPWRRAWTRSELLSACVLGLVLGAMNASLYLSLARLPIATAVTCEFLGPLVLAVVTASGWVVRIWALPAATGVVLLGGGLSAGDVLGVVFALVAAGCWAAYIVLNGRMGRTGSGVAGLTLGLLAAAVILVPLGAVTAGAALVVPSTLALGLGIAVLSSAIPYSLDLLALRRLPTAVFGVLTSLNPGIAALAGLLVLDQRLAVPELVGVALVMLASAGVTLARVGRRDRL